MVTIAITGSAGLIGSNLSHKLAGLGHKVVGIDSLIGGYEDNMPTHENFVFYRTDILNTFTIQTIFKAHTPDIVIHCAALAHEGLSVFSPKTITENIYAGTVSVASAAIACNVSLFVNTSSMARYGDIEPPFKENSKPRPIDPYGLAKYHAEQQLNLLSDIHGIKVVHMVPHNVCGPRQCYSDPFRNVMSIFANRILHDKPIYIYGNGTQKRSFSHIDDCVDAYITIISNQIPNKSVYNIGPDDGSEIDINTLARLVGTYFNKQPEIIHLPDRPREVKDAWVSTDKAKTELLYTTKFSVHDTVRDTITWIKNSPERDFNYHLTLEIINDKTPTTWTKKLYNS